MFDCLSGWRSDMIGRALWPVAGYDKWRGEAGGGPLRVASSCVVVVNTDQLITNKWKLTADFTTRPLYKKYYL